MDIGIGLPATIPGVERGQLLEWARRAEARGFSSLGTIDRIVYPNLESLIALAAAAAVTERIRLATTILIAPYRANGALVAKQAASVDVIANGRLVFGVAVGGREDDYAASGVDFHHRGRIMDEMLDEWSRVWAGESFGTAGGIGPEPPNGRPQLVVGGGADAVYERVAKHADGWILGGGTPDQLADGKAKTEAAWKAAGRAQQDADRYLKHYYAWLGDEFAGMIAGSAAKDPATVQGYLQAFADAGCNELILFPCSPDPGQVDLLADAAGL
jgi:alkanesulfonate monooxygenase SsuD/methylene tetrahydromethanopterin reductase-like flavin-dependent oxidoreductase (luciferase family)